MANDNFFGRYDLESGEEDRLKTRVYDTSMNPREWMARNGHRILVGDGRMFKYQDKEFERWIYTAYEALATEGLEKLWKEFLPEEEIVKVREMYENP